ncbi:MAG TPA: HAD family phosphatase [Bacteroidota bacterium]|nr:HAD family phosphatase [Bacteroidota bacterium]
MKIQPALVMFDLGNVLVHIHPEAFLQTLGIDTPENRKTYGRDIVDLVRKYERADDTTEKFLANLDVLVNAKSAASLRPEHVPLFSSDDFRRAMLSILGRPVPGMEELVRSLCTKVPLSLLSNTNPLHFDACMEHLGALQYIPAHYLSYRLKALKPDPAIFQRVLDLLQRDPHEVLYIDDLIENVEAAQKFGFNSYQFVGPDQLRSHLSDLGLL